MAKEEGVGANLHPFCLLALQNAPLFAVKDGVSVTSDGCAGETHEFDKVVILTN